MDDWFDLPSPWTFTELELFMAAFQLFCCPDKRWAKHLGVTGRETGQDQSSNEPFESYVQAAMASCAEAGGFSPRRQVSANANQPRSSLIP